MIQIIEFVNQVASITWWCFKWAFVVTFALTVIWVIAEYARRGYKALKHKNRNMEFAKKFYRAHRGEKIVR